jgi:hypothetical protein
LNSQPPSLLTESPLFAIAFFGLFISLLYQTARLLMLLLMLLIRDTVRPLIITLITVFLEIYSEEFTYQQTSNELRELRFNILNSCA